VLEVTTIGLDLAKHTFQLHGADRQGAVLFRKKLRRQQLLPFLAVAASARVGWMWM
jgi:transposase